MVNLGKYTSPMDLILDGYKDKTHLKFNLHLEVVPVARLLAWGDNSKGQLGVGHLQESHEP